MQITESVAPEVAAAFLRQPDVYGATADDFAPEAQMVNFEEFIRDPAVCTYSVLAEDNLVGIVQYSRRNAILCEVYVNFLPGYRGVFAKRAIRWTIGDIFLNKGMVSIVSYVAASNVPCIRLARAIGFVHCGRIRQALVREGKVEDLVILGVTRHHDTVPVR